MQVQSISNPSFEGKRDRVDAMINLDDRAIQQKAYERTLEQINPDAHKRNKRITNTLFYSAPLAAGLARTLLSEKSETTLFTKKISGVAGRMAQGLKTAAFLTALLGAVDILGALRNKAHEKSDDVRKFDRKHPAMSFMTSLGAGIALITAFPFAVAKSSKLFTPEFANSAAKKVGTIAKKVNDSNAVDVMKNAWKIAGEKTPNWIKNVGAVALDWSPAALLFGGMFNSLRGSNERTADFVQKYNDNYSRMKEKQVSLSRARLGEISKMAILKDVMLQQAAMEKAMLAVQNDLLMQDKNNQIEMAIVNDGARADMPQEVIDKVDALRVEKAGNFNEELSADEAKDIQDEIIEAIKEEIEIPQGEEVEE